MEFLLVMLGIACLLAFFWISVFNASVLWASLRRRPRPSWIPLLGGVLGTVGLLLMPLPSLHALWWVPLLLDWGSLPGLAHTVVWHAVRRLRARHAQ